MIFNITQTDFKTIRYKERISRMLTFANKNCQEKETNMLKIKEKN